jgi:hypothetical protein
MSLLSLAEAAQASGVAEWMRSAVKAMPIVEALHVLAVALVFGTVLVVDLRLLGFPDTRRAVTRVSDELLKLTWAAFGLAVVTGAMMFAANAVTYYNNTAFRLKLLALLAAGLNMAVFQFLTYRGVAAWDRDRPSPAAARLAALLSILIWLTVIFLGRWIGFTKGYDFTIPDEVQFEFGG